MPVIFISYSHKDRDELEYVRSHLSPLLGLGVVTIWDDNELQIGDDWKGDINSAIDACKVFILLVSRHSLGSKFIRETEVPRILPRWQAKQARFCPLVVTPCHMGGFWWLDAANRRPKDGKALSELPMPERDREMAGVVGQVAKQVASPNNVESHLPPANAVAPATPASRVIDYSRLPETPYKNLVGRDDELTELDEAWFDRQTNIVSLIAWGGAGKTSLINEWLVRLQQANYRDAETVLGWSFYSQGTKERATSADIFLDWALDRLGITGVPASATAKGDALTRALASRRILLVLDGIEPLQHGPGEQEGLLKDPGLRALLRGFAMTAPSTVHGLLVLTSRLVIRDIEKFRQTEARPGPSLVVDLEKLSDEAGAALLRDNGVKGTEAQLSEAAHEFEGHALALSLLASFITRRFMGDIRQRDRIGPILQKADMRGHGHARRVMQAYENEWLKDEPVLLAIMEMVGLFDRPASAGCLEALRRKPAVDGLTGKIVDLSSSEWADAIAALRDIRLLDPTDPSAPNSLDAHPLVREWFGERLRERNNKGWREAHGRLYEHLRDTTEEGAAPTLGDLAPLYQAIAHACRASRHHEGLHDILLRRTSRGINYANAKLGALGTNLVALSWFFDQPFEVPIPSLSEVDRSWVLGGAAFCLRAQGRFTEALSAERAGLLTEVNGQRWESASVRASNLSQVELLAGEVAASVATALKSAAYAERSGVKARSIICLSTHANALHAAGQREAAALVYADAERLQREMQPEFPVLYSMRGHEFCELLLASGDYATARERAAKTLQIAQRNNWLLDIALDTLMLSRADVGLVLAVPTGAQQPMPKGGASTIRVRIDEAIEGLRNAGRREYVAPGYSSRAAFRRNIGDWGGAAGDLDEVEEISESGPMRLYLCDTALERARLLFARIEAFAPLNGMLEKDNPPKPVVPPPDEIAELKDEAEKQIKIADDYIQACGYHRRDEELAELYAVLRDEKKFAELPPRV